VAGIISLLNDYRISNGDPPLGFLNTWLYGRGRLGNGLQDITSGSNPGCNTDGFTAIPGWDPVRPARLLSLSFSTLADVVLHKVTGLGTLKFQFLLNALPVDDTLDDPEP
jgi:hypothetical protein